MMVFFMKLKIRKKVKGDTTCHTLYDEDTKEVIVSSETGYPNIDKEIIEFATYHLEDKIRFDKSGFDKYVVDSLDLLGGTPIDLIRRLYEFRNTPLSDTITMKVEGLREELQRDFHPLLNQFQWLPKGESIRFTYLENEEIGIGLSQEEYWKPKFQEFLEVILEVSYVEDIGEVEYDDETFYMKKFHLNSLGESYMKYNLKK